MVVISEINADKDATIIFNRPIICVVLICLAAAASPAGALTPQEVLVVANGKDKDSVALGRYYVKARGIPEKNLLIIKTSKSPYVSRDHYEKHIRQPIREYLLANKLVKQIRCICLMWGVPVRVQAPHAREVVRLRRKLWIDHGLLARVCKTFPAAKTNGLTPLEKLFESPLPSLPRKLPKVKDLTRNISKLLEEKLAEAGRISDPGKRRIASRQLMALQLELNGLRGLIRHIEQVKPEGAPDVKDLKKQLTEVQVRLTRYRRAAKTAGNILAKLNATLRADGLIAVSGSIGKQVYRDRADAAVDSELAALWWNDYAVVGPLPNTLHWRAAAAAKGGRLRVTLMAARIDGPSAKDSRRIIADSIATEKVGLTGTMYIDAGGPHVKYEIHLQNTKIKIVLDENKAIFPKASCPDAALYVGWYSLRKYVPAFTWNRGAVGWHIASFEAQRLRSPKANEWCPKMIQNGVAATLGAVAEPYLGAFPLPEDFFGLLLTGKYTLAECYWRTVPHLSWRMTLIGDPLYNPFKAAPQVDPRILPSGLRP